MAETRQIHDRNMLEIRQKSGRKYLLLPYLTEQYLTEPYLTEPYLTEQNLTLPDRTLQDRTGHCRAREDSAGGVGGHGSAAERYAAGSKAPYMPKSGITHFFGCLPLLVRSSVRPDLLFFFFT